MRKVIKSREKNRSNFMFDGIQVSIKDALPKEVDLRKVLTAVKSVVPNKYFRYIDAIYIGQFEMLRKNDFSAVYDQGAIFLSNRQVSEVDTVSHMVHEFAHAVEQNNASLVYTDGAIEREFLSKRERVHSLLSSEGFDISLSSFYDVEYNPQLDDILYNDIGYPMLAMLTTNIFYSPYAITSINEYFANTFEVFYNKRDVGFVKKVCPEVYYKIIELENNND